MFPDPWHRNQEENLSESMTVILVGPRRKYPQSIATENQISRERRACKIIKTHLGQTSLHMPNV